MTSDLPFHNYVANKQDAMDRIHVLIGLPTATLGPGSKEHKESFRAIARFLGLNIDPQLDKIEFAAAISMHLGIAWEPSCWSAGGTITLEGLNRILRGLLNYENLNKMGVETVATQTSMDEFGPEQNGDESGYTENELQSTIANQLIELLSTQESPTEFDPSPYRFELADIRFSDNSWMSALAAVQGWLFLDELDLSDPNEFLTQLVKGLGFEDASKAIEESQGSWALNQSGLDRLSERLSKATRLKDEFLADLEVEGGTRESATGRWLELWEDEESEEDLGSGPVTASTDIWSISDFSSRADSGKLDLSPSYQRGDVWPTANSQMLIESVLRGIPLPSVIILRKGGDEPYEVVDGKQRLTSILRFIGKHPRALEIVRDQHQKSPDAGLWDLFQNDYPKFKRVWKNVTGTPLSSTVERENYFPFRIRTGITPLVGDMAQLQGKYYTEIKSSRVVIADMTVTVEELFESTTDYKVPLIAYSKATPRQIHEVFNLYNKQGKHLNAEEIRNALFHNLDFMRSLMVLSGDSADQEGIAPFLKPAWNELKTMSRTFDDYGFGTARYRRTKVLSWLSAMLLFDSVKNGEVKKLSTAKHIDALLKRIEDDPSDPLRDRKTILKAAQLINFGVSAHATVNYAFAPKFKDNSSGAKWQELQLIASLLGVTMAATVLKENLLEKLDLKSEELLKKSGSREWHRPSKTQTESQWSYISTIALHILDVLEVDRIAVDNILRSDFGYSPVTGLKLNRIYVGN